MLLGNGSKHADHEADICRTLQLWREHARRNTNGGRTDRALTGLPNRHKQVRRLPATREPFSVAARGRPDRPRTAAWVFAVVRSGPTQRFRDEAILEPDGQPHRSAGDAGSLRVPHDACSHDADPEARWQSQAEAHERRHDQTIVRQPPLIGEAIARVKSESRCRPRGDSGRSSKLPVDRTAARADDRNVADPLVRVGRHRATPFMKALVTRPAPAPGMTAAESRTGRRQSLALGTLTEEFSSASARSRLLKCRRLLARPPRRTQSPA